MKKYYYLAVTLLTTILFCSCSQQYYEFYQVYKATPSNNIDKTSIEPDGIVYRDSKCEVFYNFWSKYGNMSFAFYNKTDSIIYIDLTNSFFLNNNISYDYYTERALTNSALPEKVTTSLANMSALYGRTSQPFSNNVLGNNPTNNHTVYTALPSPVKANQTTMVAIAPHSYKVIFCEYAINVDRYLSCDFRRFPSQADSVSFGVENTPLTFSNYITYWIGTNKNVVENKFYISQITNIPLPLVYTYKEIYQYDCRDKNKSFSPERYVRVVNIPSNQYFYLQYNTTSKESLYHFDGDTYVRMYNGYYEKAK